MILDQTVPKIFFFLYFSEGHIAFGTLTLLIPTFPAMAATVMFLNEKKKGTLSEDEEESRSPWKKFVKHLPFSVLWTIQKKLRRVASRQAKIVEAQKKIDKLRKKVEAVKAKGNERKYHKKKEEYEFHIQDDSLKIAVWQKQINDIKTDLQWFKIYTIVHTALLSNLLSCYDLFHSSTTWRK